MSHARTMRRRRYPLVCEALENRCLPAVTASVTAGVLDIVGDNAGNQASIRLLAGDPTQTQVVADGGGGTNTLDYANFGAPVRVNIATQAATGIASTHKQGWQNLQNFIGSGTGSSLAGPSADTNWTIAGAGAGTVGAGSFSGFPEV